jgi:Flp pilus assembly pilin Flp
MMRKQKRKEGQAMVEYIIIVAVVAIATLVIFGMFGDMLKKKLGGAVDELDGGSEGASAAGDSSVQQLQDLGGD